MHTCRLTQHIAIVARCSSNISPSGCLPSPECSDRCPHPQGGAEKLSDEDIEATLEKVIKLLAFISDKVPHCPLGVTRT